MEKRHKPPISSFPGPPPYLLEPGESSSSYRPLLPPLNTKEAYCNICTYVKQVHDMFRNKNCKHSHCRDCVIFYVSAKLNQGVVHITCMESGCRDGFLDPETCRKFLPEELYSRWGNALCEAAFPESVKFYCPFKDCSALLIYDEGDEEMRTVTYNVCPHCSREFCRTCRVAWHSGITCEDHSEVAAKNEDEVVLMMAEEFRWRRCPRCSFLVEKISGCSHVKCRCGCHFCYKCGFDKLKEIPYHQCDRTRARITFPNHRNPYQFPQMVPAQVIASLNYQVPTEGLHNEVVVISSYPLELPVTCPNDQ